MTASPLATPPVPVMCAVLPFLSIAGARSAAAVSKRWFAAATAHLLPRLRDEIPSLEEKAASLSRRIREVQPFMASGLPVLPGHALTAADVTELARVARGHPPAPTIAIFRCVAAILRPMENGDPVASARAILSDRAAALSAFTSAGSPSHDLQPPTQMHLTRLMQDPMLQHYRRTAHVGPLDRLWQWVTAVSSRAEVRKQMLDDCGKLRRTNSAMASAKALLLSLSPVEVEDTEGAEAEVEVDAEGEAGATEHPAE